MALPVISEINEEVRPGTTFAIGPVTITVDGAAYSKTAQQVTCSIYDERDMANALIDNLEASIGSASSPLTVTLNLSAGQSASLHSSPNLKRAIPHILDFEVLATDGTILNSDQVRIFCVKRVTQ